MATKRMACGVVAFLLLTVLLTGCGEQGDAVPDVVGMDLQSAQDTLQAAGFYNLGSHDVTGESSFQVLDRNWRVVNQTPAAGTQAPQTDRIELGVERI